MKSALIAAIVAAVVSASAATAADGWIRGSQIKPGTIRISRLTPGAIARLQGATGPQGATGAQGPQGEQGPQGKPGATPSFSVGYFCAADDGSGDVKWGGVLIPRPVQVQPTCDPGYSVVKVLLGALTGPEIR